MLVEPASEKGNGEGDGALGRADYGQQTGIPFDTENPTITSGIRLGTPAGTTRGFGVAEFQQIGLWIADVIEANVAGAK